MPDGVDTSMYANIAQPPNPLTTVGQVAGTMNALNQNRLFGQTFAARQAIGQAYKNSIDPATGQLDTNKLMSIVANDPNAAFMAGDVAAQAQERQKNQIAIDTATFQNHMAHAQAMNGYFGSLLAKPDLSQKDVIAAAGDMVAQGLQTPPQVASELATMPQDPAQLRQWVQKYQMRNLDGAQQLQAIYGQTHIINTGGQQVPVAISPVTGETRQIGPTINNTLSPGEATAPTPVLMRNPDGTLSPSTVTRQQFAGMAQQGPVATAPALTAQGLTPGEATTPTQGPVVNGQPTMITRGQFAQTAAGGAPAATPGAANAPAAPAGGVPGAVPVGPALGQSAAADTAATGSAQSLNALHQSVATSGGRVFALEKALTGLQNTMTGPGTETRNEIVSFLAAAPGIKNFVSQANLDDVKSYDEANKYLTQYAAGQAGAMGSGTDAKLATALSGNASTHISNLAAQDVVKATIGLERMQQAQAQAFDQSNLPPEQYNKWAVGWNKNVDPRAFVMDKLTPDQQSKLVSGLSGAEKGRFAATLRGAIKGGFVTLPGQANGG